MNRLGFGWTDAGLIARRRRIQQGDDGPKRCSSILPDRRLVGQLRPSVTLQCDAYMFVDVVRYSFGIGDALYGF